MATKFLSGFLNLFFPPRCVFCGRFLKSGETALCASCQTSLPYTRGEDALQTGVVFSQCVSVLFYQSTVRDSILRFKFSGRTNYAAPYGRLMADGVRRYLQEQYDLITWVPISSGRKRKRGYDQAMLLAMAVALELSDVAVETLKKQERPSQSSLSGPDARRENIKGAYTVTAPELVIDKRILLVDDIVTTGATLDECANELKCSGAADVVCITLARSALRSKEQDETTF